MHFSKSFQGNKSAITMQSPPEKFKYKSSGKDSGQSPHFKVIQKESHPWNLNEITTNISLKLPCLVSF